LIKEIRSPSGIGIFELESAIIPPTAPCPRGEKIRPSDTARSLGLERLIEPAQVPGNRLKSSIPFESALGITGDDPAPVLRAGDKRPEND